MIITAILQWLLAYSAIFVGGAFLLVVASVYWPGRKARFQRDAMIPLDDDR